MARPRNVSFLLIGIILLAAGPIAAQEATPLPATAGEPAAEALIEATVDEVDIGVVLVDTIGLARYTFSPGAQYEFGGGPVLFAIEAGALTVEETLYHTGDQIVLNWVRSNVVVRNEAPETAVAVVVVFLRDYSDEMTSRTGVTIEVLAELRDGPGRFYVQLSLERHQYEGELESELARPANGFSLLVVESGLLSVQPSGQSLHKVNVAEESVPIELDPDQRVDLLPGAWLFVSPDTVAVRNEAPGATTVLVLTFTREVEDENGRPAGTPIPGRKLGAILAAPLLLPPGPLTVQVVRFRFEPGLDFEMTELPAPQALVVETGRLDVELVGGAIRGSSSDPPTTSWEEPLEAGERLTMVPGDQLIMLDDLEGIRMHIVEGEAVEILAVRFAGADPPGAFSTIQAVDGQTMTVLAEGELADVPFGTAGIELGRFELGYGQARGPISLPRGPAFLAAEAGTLGVDLFIGSGTLWQDGKVREIAPGDETILATGDMVLLEQGVEATLENVGSDQLVVLSLIIRECRFRLALCE